MSPDCCFQEPFRPDQPPDPPIPVGSQPPVPLDAGEHLVTPRQGEHQIEGGTSRATSLALVGTVYSPTSPPHDVVSRRSSATPHPSTQDRHNTPSGRTSLAQGSRDTTPTLPYRPKGKRRMVYSDDEGEAEADIGGGSRGSPTPRPEETTQGPRSVSFVTSGLSSP